MADAKTILAMDAACGPCSVALTQGEALLAYAREDRPTLQAARLVPLVEAAMREAGMGFDAVDAIAATVGPGSFTGIRIALAAARGFGFAAGKPVHGISTLACLAQDALAQKPEATAILALLPAGKGEAYAQLFGAGPLRATSDIMLCAPEMLMPHIPHGGIVTGAVSLLPPLPKTIHAIEALPDARAAASIAAGDLPELVLPPLPLYIRPPDAKLPAA